MKRKMLILLLCSCFLLSGCSMLLERSYSSVTPHSAAYWENEAEDTLRADSYQDLVNALLLLVAEHSEEGTVRLYGMEEADKAQLAALACREVEQETALGAYLLDYISYSGTQNGEHYDLAVVLRYRRTVEEQQAIINVSSTDAIADFLSYAWGRNMERLVLRVGYFTTDRAGVEKLVYRTQLGILGYELPPEEEILPGEETDPEAPGEEPVDPEAAAGGSEAPAEPPAEPPAEEVPPEGEEPPVDDPSGEEIVGEEPLPEPWQVVFYPDTEEPGIVEIILR